MRGLSAKRIAQKHTHALAVRESTVEACPAQRSSGNHKISAEKNRRLVIAQAVGGRHTDDHGPEDPDVTLGAKRPFVRLCLPSSSCCVTLWMPVKTDEARYGNSNVEGERQHPVKRRDVRGLGGRGG